ncbi:spermatogenesis-associated protein 6-like isoform X2 [Polyodon spathula]|uniref:spermatogenesis-associated protein 6-like isoform X2 n=1 Tax=Polyodon spathula TaxID=7913 RepID=UPI001B7DDA5E|nr:spermatogenesis-associated protein 6-like isoform X2 [Polyodon spathula]
MPQKAVKVVVEFQLHAVTCPGVFLTDKDDVYLSVCIMGQYRKSACRLPVFPLLFHEKMTFEKVFKMAMDPAAVAEQLEYETAKFELIQLFPPVGETLASYEEEARSFLFPEPKLSPTYPGVDREVLMRRTPNFPGIAPKLEFSTTTTIKECSFKREKGVCSNNNLVDSSRPISKHDSPPQLSPDLLISRSRSTSPKSHLSGDISFGSPRQKNAMESSDRGTQDTGHLASTDADDLVSYSPNSNSSSALRSHMKSPTSASMLLSSPSLLNRSPLRQRFKSDSNNTWESIHDRVRNLLTTHSARQRLSFGATESEVAEVLERRSISPSNFSMEKRY